MGVAAREDVAAAGWDAVVLKWVGKLGVLDVLAAVKVGSHLCLLHHFKYLTINLKKCTIERKAMKVDISV